MATPTWSVKFMNDSIDYFAINHSNRRQVELEWRIKQNYTCLLDFRFYCIGCFGALQYVPSLHTLTPPPPGPPTPLLVFSNIWNEMERGTNEFGKLEVLKMRNEEYYLFNFPLSLPNEALTLANTVEPFLDRFYIAFMYLARLIS